MKRSRSKSEELFVLPGLVRRRVEEMELRWRLGDANRYSFHDDSTSDRDEDCARELELGYVALDLMPFVSAEKAGQILDQLTPELREGPYVPYRKSSPKIGAPKATASPGAANVNPLKTRPDWKSHVRRISLIIGSVTILLFALILLLED